MHPGCPFCSPPAERVMERTPLVLVLRDGYPVSPGHALVIPRRHVGSFFAATPAEREAILDAIVRVKSTLDELHAPAGYNVGVNDGPAAGQTVAHCHVHVIPRYAGDVEDLRGGVRWVIPVKARYW
jgi:diadenosine tetraphosphate (Ap4A) HIT family hydrolase